MPRSAGSGVAPTSRRGQTWTGRPSRRDQPSLRGGIRPGRLPRLAVRLLDRRRTPARLDRGDDRVGPIPRSRGAGRAGPRRGDGRGIRLDRAGGPRCAIACASDLLAMGVERAARRRGWVPGRDIGITGLDDSSYAGMLNLTSVSQPVTTIADYLLGLVHKRIEGGPPPESGALFRPALVTRASSDPNTCVSGMSPSRTCARRSSSSSPSASSAPGRSSTRCTS